MSGPVAGFIPASPTYAFVSLMTVIHPEAHMPQWSAGSGLSMDSAGNEGSDPQRGQRWSRLCGGNGK